MLLFLLNLWLVFILVIRLNFYGCFLIGGFRFIGVFFWLFCLVRIICLGFVVISSGFYLGASLSIHLFIVFSFLSAWSEQYTEVHSYFFLEYFLSAYHSIFWVYLASLWFSHYLILCLWIVLLGGVVCLFLLDFEVF